MTKRKDERRELLKEDEFQTFFEKTARGIQEEPVKYLGPFAGALVVLAAIFGFFAYQRSAAIEVASELYQVEEMLRVEPGDENADYVFDDRTQQLEAVLQKLDDVIGRHSGSVAQQARIQKVRVLQDLGRYDNIEALYKDIVSNDNGFALFGHHGLADYYFANGDYDNAKSHYNKMASLGPKMPNMTDWVDFNLARCFKEEGNLKEARIRLNKILDKYGTDMSSAPPAATQAKELLDELGAEEEASDATS
jgi:tetratricopeptide (TPR) repeat protein